MTSKIKITIFPNKKNLFYWPAAKKIVSIIRESSKKFPDWILICNNDITFSDKFFFKYLKSINSKRYPIIGPDILNDVGNHLNPFMLKPLNIIQKIYWKFYFSSYIISKILLIIKKTMKSILIKNKKIKSQKKQIVYSVHGSGILFSSHFFNSGGWLDGNFDLYGEELSVSEIAKKVSTPITYFPDLKINHHEHSITKLINKKLLYEKSRQSYFYIEAKYFKK
jgi:GT2 family glycosyltransferase